MRKLTGNSRGATLAVRAATGPVDRKFDVQFCSQGLAGAGTSANRPMERVWLDTLLGRLSETYLYIEGLSTSSRMSCPLVGNGREWPLTHGNLSD